jgi:hypothetical protein
MAQKKPKQSTCVCTLAREKFLRLYGIVAQCLLRWEPAHGLASIGGVDEVNDVHVGQKDRL